MQNFSSLAGLEVAEKFVGGGVVVEQVTTVSNSNASSFRDNSMYMYKLTLALPKRFCWIGIVFTPQSVYLSMTVLRYSQSNSPNNMLSPKNNNGDD